MQDLILTGGTVVDGTGKPAFTGDVAVTHGRITGVGKDLGSARRTIKADGLLVTPGWVDVHTHYDGQLFGIRCWRRLSGMACPPSSWAIVAWALRRCAPIGANTSSR